MAFLYLTEQGSILRKAGDRLLVEKADEIVLDIPYHKLECVLLFGNVQVTTQAIAELLEKGIRLALLSRMGQYRGALEPPNAKNVERRLAQWERFRDPVAAFTLAAGVVHIKLQNSLSVLDSYARRGSAPANYQAKRNRLREASEKCWEAVDLNALNGTEGAAAKAYFETLFDFNKSEFTWPGRLKHPATDPLNALLSLTYTFILLEIRGLLEAIGLDAHLGFFHQLDYGRPSLAADLVEAFRAPVADRFVLWLVNKRMFNAGDFIQHEEGSPAVYLKPNEFTRYLTEYEKWMLRHAAGGPSFREMLRAEVTRLAKAIDEGYLFQPHTWRVEESEGSE